MSNNVGDFRSEFLGQTKAGGMKGYLIFIIVRRWSEE
jgi:hypothetical protein